MTLCSTWRKPVWSWQDVRIQQRLMQTSCFRYSCRENWNIPLWKDQWYLKPLQVLSEWWNMNPKLFKVTWGVCGMKVGPGSDFASPSASPSQELLSMIDNLLANRVLSDNREVSAVLDTVENSLRLIGPLINPPGATRTSTCTGWIEVDTVKV